MARRSSIYRVMLLTLLLGAFARSQQPEPQQPSPASQNPASPEKPSPGVESKPEQKTENATPNEKPAPQTPAVQNDVVIRGGRILTLTHGRTQNGSPRTHNGENPAIGKRGHAPP